MGLLLSNGAEQRVLEVCLNIDGVTPPDLTLKLYSNNITPGDTDVASDFTECDFTGYTDYDIDPADWSIAQGNPTLASHPVLTFTSSAGSQDKYAYGYYVVETADPTILRWAEKFTDGPYHVVNNGDVVKVTPKFSASKT